MSTQDDSVQDAGQALSSFEETSEWNDHHGMPSAWSDPDDRMLPYRQLASTRDKGHHAVPAKPSRAVLATGGWQGALGLLSLNELSPRLPAIRSALQSGILLVLVYLRRKEKTMLDARQIAEQVKRLHLRDFDGWRRHFGSRRPTVSEIQPNTYSFEPDADGWFRGNANILISEEIDGDHPTLVSERLVAVIAGQVVNGRLRVDQLSLRYP